MLYSTFIMPLPLEQGTLSDDVRLTSVCCVHWSRTERPRKTKIGTEVAHVTHDSDTTFKVKRLGVAIFNRNVTFEQCMTVAAINSARLGFFLQKCAI